MVCIACLWYEEKHSLFFSFLVADDFASCPTGSPCDGFDGSPAVSSSGYCTPCAAGGYAFVCSKALTSSAYTIDRFSGYFDDTGVSYQISAYTDLGGFPDELIAGSAQVISAGASTMVSAPVAVRGLASVPPGGGIIWMCFTCTQVATVPYWRRQPNAGVAGPEVRYGRISNIAIGAFPPSVPACIASTDCEQATDFGYGWMALQACSDGMWVSFFPIALTCIFFYFFLFSFSFRAETRLHRSRWIFSVTCCWERLLLWL
jgi:hypothetical protein